MNHRADRDCTLDQNDICVECGVWHGDPCPSCGGRGFHNEPCPEMEPTMDPRTENALEAKRAEDFAAAYNLAVAKLRGNSTLTPNLVTDITKMTTHYDVIYTRLYRHGYTPRTVAEVIQYEAWDHGY